MIQDISLERNGSVFFSGVISGDARCDVLFFFFVGKNKVRFVECRVRLKYLVGAAEGAVKLLAREDLGHNVA